MLTQLGADFSWVNIVRALLGNFNKIRLRGSETSALYYHLLCFLE